MTLEEFLRTAAPGAIDFRLRAEPTGESGMSCYVHPLDRDGKTIYFDLDGNIITLKSGIYIKTEDPLDQFREDPA